jgi:hypothetical protein
MAKDRCSVRSLLPEQHSAKEAPHQFMEHEPGPRGSPHDPQAEGADEDEPAPFAETANTESFGSSFLLLHFGHSAFSFPYTSASNSWSQALHLYSKMGMRHSPEKLQPI